MKKNILIQQNNKFQILKRIKRLSMLLVYIPFFVSCNDWLDISPKTIAKEDDLFQTEAGFKDVLTGVYIQMAGENLYGRKMTMEFAELLAQNWVTSYNMTSTTMTEDKVRHLIRNYDFSEPEVDDVISKIWIRYYEAIVNINNLLDNLEKQNGVVSDINYKLIKGEALGLRAFLHFDILRLWGPTPLTATQNDLAIPYVTKLTKDPNNLVTVNYQKIIDYLIKDLDEAEKLLVDDPILSLSNQILNNPSSSNILATDDEWHYYRQNRFNYYAVLATKARYYSWIGEKEKAASFAKLVIDALNTDGTKKFTLCQESDMADGDLTLSKEHIFSLHCSSISTLINPIFIQFTGLTQDRTKLEEAYESLMHPDDIRFKGTRIWENRSQGTTATYRMFFKKYWQTHTDTKAYLQLIPLIRLSEMYFIVMEGTSLSEASSYFQNFRIARNMSSSIDAELVNSNALYDRLEKEYRKDFYGEGQLFFYYKRLNYENIKWPTLYILNAEDYRIPKPEDQSIFE